MTRQFHVGQKVRIRDDHPSGHVRTPLYVRGKEGLITGYQGDFHNPETLAYGGDGLPEQPLYRVLFRQADLWPDYGGPPRDTAVVEIYQHWLEPVAEDGAPTGTPSDQGPPRPTPGVSSS